MPQSFVRVGALLAAAVVASLAACSQKPDDEAPSHSKASSTSTPASAAATTPAAEAATRRASSTNRATHEIPVLVVNEGTGLGMLEKVGFRLRRSSRDKPLSVAIKEDTPGGSGESMRASIWLAATVAALDRYDDLAGVEITVDLPGMIDGPSAGGVLCLAIMSALDDRPFPDDIAMTGTILPDGTIGAVGGVVAKMDAAAKAGAKRVLAPALLRFDKDSKTGQDVDLKQHAINLGMEYIPVDNITQVYAAAHRLPLPSRPSIGSDTLELSMAADNLLKKRYDDNQKAGDAIWGAFTQAQKDAIAKDSYSHNALIDNVARAKRAYQAGHFLFAAETMRGWNANLVARKATDAFTATLPGTDYDADCDALTTKLAAVRATFPDEITQIHQSQKNLPDTASQFCAGFYEPRSLFGMIMQTQDNIAAAEAQLKVVTDAAKIAELHAQNLASLRLELLLINAAVSLAATSNASADAWKGVVTPVPLTGDPVAVERLFFNAFMAAQNSFQKVIIHAIAAAANTTDAGAATGMARFDPTLVLYSGTIGSLPLLHQTLAAGPADDFTRAVAANVYACNLALVSGLLSRWGDFQPDIIDGVMTYTRPDVVSDLLNSARETALVNLSLCKARGIPCQQALYYFDAAELSRDEVGRDKVDVLIDYWKSSLQAKVLLMLFTPDPNHPVIAPATATATAPATASATAPATTPATTRAKP